MNYVLLRFFCFLGLFVSIFSINFINQDIFTQLNAYDIQFYFTNFEDVQNFEYQKNGFGYFVGSNDYTNFLDKNYDGFCFKTKLNLKEIQKFLNYKVVNTQNLGHEIIYAFSTQMQKYSKNQNFDINLQLVVFEDYILVGYPVLLGSY